MLESAHVRDLLSVLRLVPNPKDEIGWMRYLTRWKGIGDVTASQLIEKIMSKDDLEQCLKVISKEPKLPEIAARTCSIVRDLQNDVAMAVSKAFQTMEELLAEKYKNQEWEKRRGDFALVRN